MGLGVAGKGELCSGGDGDSIDGSFGYAQLRTGAADGIYDRECERSRCGRECGGRKESKVDKQENEDGWDWRLEEIREREFSARYRGKRKVLQQGTFSDVMPE